MPREKKESVHVKREIPKPEVVKEILKTKSVVEALRELGED